jgi:tetratricopeptide (TPR) repeat protein
VEKGDFKAAGESFLRLANHRNFGRLIDGVQAHVLFAAGINCLRLEEMEKAAELFSRALAIRPDNARAFSGRGHALAGMGCLPEAAADYERFLSLRYDYLESIDVHLTLGQIYRLMGKISRERLELQRVREKGFARLIP